MHINEYKYVELNSERLVQWKSGRMDKSKLTGCLFGKLLQIGLCELHRVVDLVE